MPLDQFTFLCVALLLTPGPTNTLLGLSGAQVGFLRSVRLIPAELAGYFLCSVPLALIGQDVIGRLPVVEQAIKLVAAGWVLWLAVKLWRGGAGGRGGEVTTARVLITTALNPKNLVFGLILLPAGAMFSMHLAVLGISIAACAAAWAMAGSFTRVGGESATIQTGIERGAACWLAVVSVSLASGAALN